MMAQRQLEHHEVIYSMVGLRDSARWSRGLALLLLSTWLLGWLWPGLATSAPSTAETRQQVFDEMLRLMQQARALQAEGKETEAIPLMERAVALGEQGLEPAALPTALALDMLGLLYYKHDDLARAEALYQRALAIHDKAQGPEHVDVASTLTSLATIALAREDFGRAEALFQRALSIQEKALGPEHTTVATTLYSLGTLYQRQGDYGRAEPMLRRALAIKEQTHGPEHFFVALTLNNLAFLLYEKGDYTQAEALYLRSLAVQEKVFGPEHTMVATTLNNLAVLYRVKGDYVRAEPLITRALAIQEKALGPEHPDVAIALTTLALLYDEKGDDQRALPLLQRALAIREKALGPESTFVATTLENIALITDQQGDTAQAEALYQRALAIKEKVLGPAHPLVATTLSNLATPVAERGDFAQAEALLRRALAIREKVLGSDHPDVAIVLNNLAHVSFIQHNFVQEEALYRRALAIAEKSLGPEHPTVATYLSNLATIFWGRGDMPQTVTFLSRAAEIREHNLAILLTTGSEEQKRRYMATLSNETDATVALHVRAAPQLQAAAELAMTTILRRKGRVLDAMADQITALRRRLDAEDRALLDQWSAVRSTLAQLALQDEGTRPPEHRLAEKARLEAEVERLEAQISARSAAFRTEVQPVTLSGVQQAIPEDAALIEMAIYRPYDPQASAKEGRFGAARYVAYVLRHAGPLQWVDLGEAAPIDREVDQLRRALRQPARADVQQGGRALDELVMRPVRSLLGNTRHLLLSADGALNLVPFGALVDEQQRYLVESSTITYLTSGRDLLRLQASTQSREGAVVFANPRFASRGSTDGAAASEAEPATAARRSGDLANAVFLPLPGTQQEAAALAAILPHATVFTAAQATEAHLKHVHGPAILHIATHGFFLADQPPTDALAQRGLVAKAPGRLTDRPSQAGSPASSENPLLRSGLALTGANDRQGGEGEDGVLTALEAAGLDLWGTKLVVLSACETGVGEVRMGDGVYGLRRALVLAGVESQVMSLWQVSDEATRDLMVAYYQRLQAGEGRTDALRQVQLSMLRGPAWQHPFFWASFIQSGDWRKLAP
jgi:CHAT domain-containing protein/Tfp pilus assembly protein PilF